MHGNKTWVWFFMFILCCNVFRSAGECLVLLLYVTYLRWPVFIPLLCDIVKVLLLGCPIEPFFHLFIRLFLSPFVRSYIVTMISHEWLEQF